jgi:hypothetical protein
MNTATVAPMTMTRLMLRMLDVVPDVALAERPTGSRVVVSRGAFGSVTGSVGMWDHPRL